MNTHLPMVGLATEGTWFKSSYSDPGQNCVEIADLTATPHPSIAVRDSKNPHGPALLLHPSTWSSFVTHISHNQTT
ncbi:DUF397 domain-containing protein [Streptomyces sp. NPDC003006]